MIMAMERKLISELIDEYRACTCLWRIKDPDYKNKERKNEAYESLLRSIKKYAKTRVNVKTCTGFVAGERRRFSFGPDANGELAAAARPIPVATFGNSRVAVKVAASCVRAQARNDRASLAGKTEGSGGSSARSTLHARTFKYDRRGGGRGARTRGVLSRRNPGKPITFQFKINVDFVKYL